MQSVLHKVIGPKEVYPEHLDGYTAVVTGGANGIGYQVARILAKGGCKVIMVNRSEDQGHDAINEIRSEFTDAQIEWKQCDLGSLKEVREVFTQIASSLERLDFLVLSAGINVNFYDTDADGIDRHFGVNWLGNFYVTNLLWPIIVKTSKRPNTPAPRICFEASEVHRMAPSDLHFSSLEEINNPKTDPTHLYARTKLAMILFAKFTLAKDIIAKNNLHIIATSVHPGTVNTNMQQQWKDAYPGITGTLISWAMQAVGRSVEQGAYSALWALTAPEVEEKGWNGWYFNDPGQPGKETAQASDENLAKALMELSTKIVKEKVGEDALVDWDNAA